MSREQRMELEEWSIGEIIANIQSQFSHLSETPSLDSQVFLAHITGKNRAWLLAHPEAELNLEQRKVLDDALLRLEAGEPLPYVLGHWEFFGLDFTITPDTLIPRPETELMIEQALDWLRDHPSKRQVADVGTGSGCIAISLAVQIEDLYVTASDTSSEALQIAQSNAEKHTVSERIDFVQTDLLPGNMRTCDLICANLPYIPTETLKQLDVYGREPTLALDGGSDGLDLIRKLLPQAAQILAPEGLLLLEIEITQGSAVLSLAQEHFPTAQVELLPDLADRDRLIRIETIST
jgi:release factor glutamine methyltransferase